MPESTPYDEAIQFTLGNEGGYYDGSEARDPNPTNFGVTQQTYDEYHAKRDLSKQSVKFITMAEVEDIYRGYWIDGLSRLTSITVFDHSINAGPENAVKCLQRAVCVEDDGVLGPKTLAAIQEFLSDYEHDGMPTVGQADLANRVCWERLRYYLNLCEHSERLRPNLTSWLLRVVKFREKYLK